MVDENPLLSGFFGANSHLCPLHCALLYDLRYKLDEACMLEPQHRVVFLEGHVSGLGIEGSLGQAIEFLHSNKLIHTDLKPENVLLTSWDKREVKLDSGDVIRVPAAPHIKGDTFRELS